MTTIRDAFAAKYAQTIETGDVDQFVEYVRSQVSNINLANTLNIPPTTVSYRMRHPILLLKMIADNPDVEVNLSTERNISSIDISTLPTKL